MKSALLDSANRPKLLLERSELSSGHAETWLQALLFEQPDLVPLDALDPGAGAMIPLVRELALSKAGGRVYLDILGVTPRGRLVLIECKLWRNPQARREVVAQILEYAALLRRCSYADLTAQLKARHGFEGQNPIYERVRSESDLGEAAFADRVAENLRTGDFDLIVAGDGIREDMSVIADHLSHHGARLALVEFQIWEDGAGTQLVVPSIPFRTEVHRQRILVTSDGIPLEVDNRESDVEVETVTDPGSADRRAQNRAFWQRFIDEVDFDHPEQPSPRHGGNNWIRIPLPGDVWMTAYRNDRMTGLFIPKKHVDAVADLLREEGEAIRQEISLPGLRFHTLDDPAKPTIAVDEPLTALPSEDAQIEWLTETANRLVNALRPRLREG
ncbi:hypothetical protein [Marinovum sp.]|uniref:hypothetical protein n=1 Tax=Marinovum sp. TaxID=2024839 RepID=UPI003A90E5AB